MFYGKNKLKILLVLYFVSSACYASDMQNNSLISTLSAMDLNSVKKQNDEEIISLIKKLNDHTKGYTDIRKTTESSELTQSILPPDVADNNGDTRAIPLPGDENKKSNSQPVNNNKLTTDTPPKTSPDSPVNSSEMDEKNTSSSDSISSLKEQIDALNQQVVVISDELTTLIRLQKLMYDNKTISDEMVKSSTFFAGNGKVKKETYLDIFSKKEGVYTDPSGFAYYIIKSGSGKLRSEDLFKLTLTEKNTAGKELSSVNNIPLKYNNTLPAIIYNAIQHIGFGGSIRVVSLAKKSYPNGDYPSGVTAYTPLIYLLDVNKVN